MSWFSNHVRGAQLVRPSQLNGWGLRSGLRLGNVRIPPLREFEHFLILGSQGSGKSSLVRSILYQIQQRGQTAIVLDPECEFVQEFYNPSRGDFILNPLDERGPFWEPWSEFRKDQMAMDVQMMTASLVRGKAHTPQQFYWQTISRRLLEKAFHATTNLQTFQGLLEQDKSDAKTGAVNATWPFNWLPPREHTNREWSALRWEAKREGWLFLTSMEDDRDAIQALQGIWLDLLITRIMSNEIGSAQTWLVGDEIATMGYQPKLLAATARGRKRGLCVILSLQNIAQLRSIYGHDPTITLVSQPATTILLKCTEPETAEWTSKLIGEHEINYTTETGKTYPRSERLVLTSEIQTLPKFHGYAISGSKRAKIKTPKLYLKSKHPDFIFRGPMGEVKYVSRSRLSEAQKNILWRGVDQRCNSKDHVSYPYYGGRGVLLKFENKDHLFEHLGDPPPDMKKPSIDRKDPNGHYEPGNVAWIEWADQQKNRRLKLRNNGTANV